MKRHLLIVFAGAALLLFGGSTMPAAAQTQSACWTNGQSVTCDAANKAALQAQGATTAAIHAVQVWAYQAPQPTVPQPNIVGYIQTVAGLPPCSGAIEGMKASVSDATSPAWNTALTGGGAVHVGAVCRGGAWLAN